MRLIFLTVPFLFLACLLDKGDEDTFLPDHKRIGFKTIIISQIDIMDWSAADGFKEKKLVTDTVNENFESSRNADLNINGTESHSQSGRKLMPIDMAIKLDSLLTLMILASQKNVLKSDSNTSTICSMGSENYHHENISIHINNSVFDFSNDDGCIKYNQTYLELFSKIMQMFGG